MMPNVLVAYAALVSAVCDLEFVGNTRLFKIGQGGKAIRTVPAVEGTKTAHDFYNYYSSSSHTGFEVANRSFVFLYRDLNTPDQLSMFWIHGFKGDEQGHAVVHGRISGIPSGTQIAQADDSSSEFDWTSTLDWSEPSPTHGSPPASPFIAGRWVYVKNTDGGAIDKLSMTTEWTLKIEGQFLEGVSEWMYFFADGSSELLNMSLPLEISSLPPNTDVHDDIQPYPSPMSHTTFCALAADSKGDNLTYTFHWGDGSPSTTVSLQEGTLACADHIFCKQGCGGEEPRNVTLVVKSPTCTSNLSQVISSELANPPTAQPTNAPKTDAPDTFTPDTLIPSAVPTVVPTATPTTAPTASPTSKPTAAPTLTPTEVPDTRTTEPTALPTALPTSLPTARPAGLTAHPAVPTLIPTTDQPTAVPTNVPLPTAITTMVPSAHTASPKAVATAVPTLSPTTGPTVSPTAEPIQRTAVPTAMPADKLLTTAPSIPDNREVTLSPNTPLPSGQTYVPTASPSSSSNTTSPQIAPEAPSQLPAGLGTVSPTEAPASDSSSPLIIILIIILGVLCCLGVAAIYMWRRTKGGVDGRTKGKMIRNFEMAAEELVDVDDTFAYSYDVQEEPVAMETLETPDAPHEAQDAPPVEKSRKKKRKKKADTLVSIPSQDAEGDEIAD
eukprot:TRINITY_DN24156_c0_g1_i1.p1 TRINITY_DN24156_c0_g1~~TRINITY_DN24156_c0_g1_i1.p1  ORF type:complete len:667 (+),score=80.20 TRINITY_DN24156_c0_g1_i1:33-2033(+)